MYSIPYIYITDMYVVSRNKTKIDIYMYVRTLMIFNFCFIFKYIDGSFEPISTITTVRSIMLIKRYPA